MAMKFNPQEEVTKSLKLKPNPELDNLTLAILQSVSLEENEVPAFKDSGAENTFEYAGLKVPSVKFVFKNYSRKDDKDQSDRFLTVYESVIISTKNDGTPMKQKDLDSLYTQMWHRIKHIHDAFKADPNYKPFAELPVIDEKAEPEKRILQFRAFFQAVVDGFNDGKGGKPVFEGEKGSLPVGIKLVANYSNDVKQNRKWHTIPTFVGEGFIERYIPGKPFTIEVKPGDIQELGSTGLSSKAASGVDESEANIEEIIARAKAGK